MLYFLLFNLLLVNSFTLKWEIPQGIDCGAERICIEDTDRDGNFEFIFTTYSSWPCYIHFYELHLPDTWEVDSVLTPGGDLLWDSGDFDVDGLFDLTLQFHIENPSLADGIMIYESPDSFSYPTQEVWRDTVGFALVTPICVYDIDKDSIPEIVKVIGDTTDLDIYESVGDNLYNRIYRFTSSTGHSPMSTLAFGDFDEDGQNEFVLGYSGGEYIIFECTGNNSYQEIELQQLPTGNIKDCFTVSDADGDGKDEFVVKGYNILGAEVHAFIFEATGDNTYEIIKTFTLTGGDYHGGYSASGDVDGDSIPEIVLEARQNVFIIKSAGNDSFYVWDSLPGNNSGSSVAVYDIDGNGLSEVVISGNNETRIYEYEEEGIEETENSKIKLKNVELTVFPNPFSNFTTIKTAGLSDYYTQKISKIELKVYDTSGRLVKSVPLTTSTISLGNELSGGIYFLKLKGKSVGKVVKVR